MERCAEVADAAASLMRAGVARGAPVAACWSDRGVGLAGSFGVWAVPGDDAPAVAAAIERALRPRWLCWSAAATASLVAHGVRLATCWDVAATHRLLEGEWRAEPARVWATLHGIDPGSAPTMGQLGLLDDHGDDGGDPDDPMRPDHHLRPEWVAGGWARTPQRLARWADVIWRAAAMQRERAHAVGLREPTVHAESAAELLCVELAADGLPIDRSRAEALLAAAVGPRAADESEAEAMRRARDDAVLVHARSRVGVDLRNPAHVRSMLAAAGIEVDDTRAWRLDAFRGTPLVDALLVWRKAERMATTFGYAWLDQQVAGGRLRGVWCASDGAAGRMTASAGLHNLPADMRGAVVAERGHVFVHADLGQIEPRVLAAVSGDPALAAAAQADDLYAPVATRLGVERAVAKVAVLAAMYGQTSGTAGAALRGMERAYPAAMEHLREADRRGRAGIDMRTYGGRLVRMRHPERDLDTSPAAAAARGRYARNAMIQGAAAELFKTWAVTLRSRLAPGDRIVLCLHDELLVHVAEERAEATAALVEGCLAEAVGRWMPGGSVRFVGAATIVRSWADAKG